MALSRICSSTNFTALLTKASYANTIGTANSRQGCQVVEELHATRTRCYPEAPRLQLPSNVSEIFNSETSRFGTERTRDIGSHLLVHGNGFPDSDKILQLDSRLDSYDCFGAVSLNGSMQTNVPKPFLATGRSTYLNMPGSQWIRDSKYLAESMCRSHYDAYRNPTAAGILNGLRFFSMATNGERSHTILTKKAMLKILAKEYGKTIIILHFSISLITLSTLCLLVYRGVDLEPFVRKFINEPAESEKIMKIIMNKSSTFLIAHSIYSLLLPIRLSMSIGFTPLFARFLRKKGIFKRPKTQQCS